MPDAGRRLPKTDKGLQAYLANIRPPENRAWIALGDGLTVCLEPNGAKTFQARIRRKGDTAARRIRIGSFPAVSLAEARRRLAEMKSIVREGGDPALAQRRARAGVAVPRKLGELIHEFLERRARQVAPKSLKIERDLLQGVLAPALGDRLLADLEPVDFGRVVSAYAARLRGEGRSQGTNANKLLSAARRMFKIARGSGLIGPMDPTAGLAKPAKETPRDRVLFDGKVLIGPDASVNEIGRLAAALTGGASAAPVSAPTRAALMLTLRMGFRALETCSLEWRAINLDGDAPTISITTSKTAAGLRTLPLPKAAAEALRALRVENGNSAPYVFPTADATGAPARRMSHLHPESLSRAFARACARLGIAGASTHDLRRTALSGLIELGHEGVAERIAGHAARDVLGRHYDRSARIAAMREALEAWSAAIDAARERALSGDAATSGGRPRGERPTLIGFAR